MLGNNPIRSPHKGDGRQLDVVRIYSTFQGEGPNAGEPAVFLRLGGCNLACDFCDTDFETFHPQPLDVILQQIAELAGEGTRLVVVTGGEPLRQPIAPLCSALLAAGYRVQIETNGTLWRDLPEAVEIVCSPKNTNGGYHPLREDVLKRAGALKFIISASHPRYQDVGEVGQAEHPVPVYLQPMDEQDETKNRANLTHTIRLAGKYGARVSLQMHKMLGVD